MKDSIDEILDRMRPYIKASGVAVDVFFVDDDFGIVELILKPRPGVTDDDLRAIQYSLEQMILKKTRGVRQVDFLAAPPLEAESPLDRDVPDLAEEDLAKLRAGTGLALDMLKTIETALRDDADGRTLRQRRQAEHFLSGPYPQWSSEAHDRFASLPRNAPPQVLLRQLRDIYPAVDRTARALGRVVEVERAAWSEALPPRQDAATPCLLQTGAVEDYADLRRILSEIRPHLGDRTLADDGCTDENEGSPPTNRLLDRIFRDASQLKIRDIYIEAGESSALLQYRVGRKIRPIAEFPRTLYRSLLVKIKHLAALDITERARRQEGQISFSETSGYKGLSVQVLTIPAHFAERVRLRLHLPADGGGP